MTSVNHSEIITLWQRDILYTLRTFYTDVVNEKYTSSRRNVLTHMFTRVCTAVLVSVCASIHMERAHESENI